MMTKSAASRDPSRPSLVKAFSLQVWRTDSIAFGSTGAKAAGCRIPRRSIQRRQSSVAHSAPTQAPGTLAE